jgi:hypothetical protein
MAGLTITIHASTCSGGGHFDVTLAMDGKSYTRTWTIDDLRRAPTGRELREAADVIARIVARKLAQATHAEAYAKMDSLTVELEPRT